MKDLLQSKPRVVNPLTLALTLLAGLASGCWALGQEQQKPQKLESSQKVAGKPLPDSKPIPVNQFPSLLKLIKPQPGEVLFHEIPWHLSVWEARQKAAAEGKPLLVWSGSGGAPIAVC